MVRIGHVVVAAAALVSGMESAFAQGWDDNVVRAEWLFPAPSSIIESHDVLVRPAVELSPAAILNDDKFSIDLGPDTVQFNFNAATNWTAETFNGWRFSDANGTIPDITGYSVDAVSAGIGNVGSIITSFGADHVQANFAGMTVTADGDFVRLKVTFAAPPTPWTDLGSGLAGISGVPLLVGAGPLLPNTTATLDLTSANPSAPANLFISLSSTPAPFKGGTLVPVPVGLTMVLMTDGAGGIALTIAHWPTGVPPGTTLYMQYAIQDAAALQGVSLSNALVAVTP